MTPKQLAEHFRRRLPLIHVVLDGWGIGEQNETNAMYHAKIPVMNNLMKQFPNTQLFAHGRYVGLPSETDLGGSEVGHLTMGAGMVLEQGPSLIQNMIESGEFNNSPVLNKMIQNCLSHQTPLHLLGLLSDGNIHSHISHFIAIIKHAFNSGVKQLYVHALLDGRDVAIQSATDYTQVLEQLFHELKSQRPEVDYAFASGGGREAVTMDRDENWKSVEAGWNLHIRGKSDHYFESMDQAISFFREQDPNIIDQALPGFVITRNGKPISPIQDNHSLIFVNFRADRAIEFTRAVVDDDFKHFDRSPRPKIEFAGMMIYDQDTQTPENFIVGSVSVESPFGKRILEHNKMQFRLTETQKFPHVTFFFNGGYREPLDRKKETYHLIESDKIPSFDLKPQMKAMEIADQAVKYILSDQYDYGLINFANADMVGHSGNLEAAIKAVELVDIQLSKIIKAMGIDTTRTKLRAFALGACWAGFVGVFFAAKNSFVNPHSFT
ncbi:MAG: phosphoglycerate mutase (2,3-diphosphoglycerate-independent), partial [SAR324 cluster bacterium]|nr:phosphoglycerate mutase (2,3-diphosphoglycerate-independent) [SAR324 cluster bacterium]